MILIPVQILLIAVAMIGFNQEWHVEEERPIGSGEDYGAGADPPRRASAASSPPDRSAGGARCGAPTMSHSRGGGSRTHMARRQWILSPSPYAVPPLRRPRNA